MKEFDPESPKGRIIRFIAMNTAASQYQIAKCFYKRVSDGYSTIRVNMLEMEKEGFIKFVRAVPNEKGGESRLYELTPLLGLCANFGYGRADETPTFQLVDSSGRYEFIEEAFEACSAVLGVDLFRTITQEAILDLQREQKRRRTERGREIRLADLIFQRVLDRNVTTLKQQTALCKDSTLIADYVRDINKLTYDMLKKSGRLDGKRVVKRIT